MTCMYFSNGVCVMQQRLEIGTVHYWENTRKEGEYETLVVLIVGCSTFGVWS